MVPLGNVLNCHSNDENGRPGDAENLEKWLAGQADDVDTTFARAYPF
jgi:hypothetical protein